MPPSSRKTLSKMATESMDIKHKKKVGRFTIVEETSSKPRKTTKQQSKDSSYPPVMPSRTQKTLDLFKGGKKQK